MSRHFRLERDPSGIHWLHFDHAGSGANVLDAEALEELDEMLVQAAQAQPRGLVILSAKPGGFVAGADVKAFAGMRDTEAVQRLILRAQEIFGRLEALAFPTVAAIHGYCLGGGLELALACRHRVATTEPETRIGFPEVKLGIFPGFGGTVRATRQAGHLNALTLMLSGRPVNGRKARRLGLVDLAVPRRQLREAARRLIEHPHARHAPPWYQRAAGLATLRPLVAAVLRRRVARKVRPDHYPAPFALIDHWRRTAGHPAAMYHSEAREVARLLTGDAAQNLIRVFLLNQRLKDLAPAGPVEARRVHVVGAGVMGGDIAAWCALQGLEVTLQDQALEPLGRATARAHGLWRKKLRDPRRVRAVADRWLPDPQGAGARGAGLVIEAIVEQQAIKNRLFKELEPRLAPGTLLATNTSSLPLESLGEGLAAPERLVGLHFFNPVARMPLVEVVHHPGTPPEILDQALAWVRRLDKLPLPVRSSPGFLVNRVLMPYLVEAVILLEEGVAPEAVDEAALAFGMPMGPVELADTVGLDIALAVARELARHYPLEVPGVLVRKVEAGRLGRKSGQGFYRWQQGKARKNRVKLTSRRLEELQDRLMLRLINEAVACLHDGVVSDADLLDAGLIFGTGFAPFRGGPLHWVRSQGVETVRERLDRLARRLGPRFRPHPGWQALAREDSA